MNEEKNIKGTSEKQAAENTDVGNTSEANSIVERADKAAERLAKENERMEVNIRRQEEIMAKQALGGRSVIQQPEKPKELTDREFKEKFLKGELKSPF